MLEGLPITLIISGGALFLFALLSIVQSIRGQVRTGCLSTLLIAITLFSFLAFVILEAANTDPMTGLNRNVALGIVGGLLVIGVVLWFLERRNKSAASALYSRGILGIGTALLLAVLFFLTPQIPENIIPIPTATPIAVAVNNNNTADTTGSNIVPTDVAAQATSTPLQTLAPTQIYTPLPSPSPTRTRRAYVPPTVTPTPQEIAVEDRCGATVTTNLNVRAEDNVDSEIVAIIPAGDYIPLNAKNIDGSWWQTEFQGETGWVVSDFLDLDPVCSLELNR